MSRFYSSEQTQHSRDVLGETLAAVPGAILIGGRGMMMSHDVDLIVTPGAPYEGIRRRSLPAPPLRLAEVGATWRGVHLDLYVPHQSRLGANLQLRVEQLAHHAETVRVSSC